MHAPCQKHNFQIPCASGLQAPPNDGNDEARADDASPLCPLELRPRISSDVSSMCPGVDLPLRHLAALSEACGRGSVINT